MSANQPGLANVFIGNALGESIDANLMKLEYDKASFDRLCFLLSYVYMVRMVTEEGRKNLGTVLNLWEQRLDLYNTREYENDGKFAKVHPTEVIKQILWYEMERYSQQKFDSFKEVTKFLDGIMIDSHIMMACQHLNIFTIPAIVFEEFLYYLQTNEENDCFSLFRDKLSAVDESWNPRLGEYLGTGFTCGLRVFGKGLFLSYYFVSASLEVNLENGITRVIQRAEEVIGVIDEGKVIYKCPCNNSLMYMVGDESGVVSNIKSSETYAVKDGNIVVERQGHGEVYHIDTGGNKHPADSNENAAAFWKYILKINGRFFKFNEEMSVEEIYLLYSARFSEMKLDLMEDFLQMAGLYGAFRKGRFFPLKGIMECLRTHGVCECDDLTAIFRNLFLMNSKIQLFIREPFSRIFYFTFYRAMKKENSLHLLREKPIELFREYIVSSEDRDKFEKNNQEDIDDAGIDDDCYSDECEVEDVIENMYDSGFEDETTVDDYSSYETETVDYTLEPPDIGYFWVENGIFHYAGTNISDGYVVDDTVFFTKTEQPEENVGYVCFDMALKERFIHMPYRNAQLEERAKECFRIDTE